MRRLNLVLLAAFRLAGARSPGFSIHEDLLTFPQFEVVFSDTYISENDANSLLERHNKHPTYSAEFPQSTLDNVREAQQNDEATDEDPASSYTYELLSMPPHRYLCSIPVLQAPSPENKTANELAKAEEARELSRATASGWELIAELEESCLYFMSGWWSYSFCNNRKITQFHALPSIPNGQPPKRDPKTAAFVLGQTPTIPASAAYQAQQEGETPPSPAELQDKGDQRYLVQRLEGGTECDLTGRDRTIEVQYHCVPGLKHDKIGWIKEVTICAYLMVVNTPRLCNDVAFLPPEETRANPITCQLVANKDTLPQLIDQNTAVDDTLVEEQGEAVAKAASAGVLEKKEINVGGVIVGARSVLSGADEDGKPPAKLAPPKSYFSDTETDVERFIDVVASGKSKTDGGSVTAMTDAQLESLELNVVSVREMVEKMRRIAKDSGWKLELVELPGGVRELRGYIDDLVDGKSSSTGSSKKKKKATEGEEEGSEEKFKKDEL
ncbi:glucosidase II beta subunit-like protein-domain-containing protein [Mariannaea sp. PMI_226]|nr:glucosidase II beta subunit-like protein-domain-containing protein [Mariannaea sp. PMI_226]